MIYKIKNVINSFLLCEQNKIHTKYKLFCKKNRQKQTEDTNNLLEKVYLKN